eukprot:13987023-Heterocapsa_arctica.AAC.1
MHEAQRMIGHRKGEPMQSGSAEPMTTRCNGPRVFVNGTKKKLKERCGASRGGEGARRGGQAH